MSRTTASIMRINQELDKISGLDGIVADKMEELENQVKKMVSDILKNHSKAGIFNYWGNNKSEISNMSDQIDKEPLLEEVLNGGELLTSRVYFDGKTECLMRYKIIKYKDNLYYIEHKEKECVTFKKLQ